MICVQEEMAALEKRLADEVEIRTSAEKALVTPDRAAKAAQYMQKCSGSKRALLRTLVTLYAPAAISLAGS